MRRRTFLSTAAGAAAITLAAPSVVRAQASTRIVFSTDWRAQAEHGGFYQAAATGLYQRAGLDVTIRMGGPQSDNQQLMAAGALDMAMASSNFFALNLLQAGAPVKSIMASFQKDPQVLITHPRADIRSIADMKGKPILISQSSRTTFWIWLRNKYGFTDDQIRSYTFNMAPFIADPTAIQQGYLSSEPFKIEKEGGIKPQVFLLADEGYPSYSCQVLCQQALIDRSPQAVQAFVNATIEGWYSYLYGDPAPANALIKRDNPDMDDATIANGIAKMKEFGIVDSGDTLNLGVGAMTEARWKEFVDIMVAQNVYPTTIPWQRAFTLDYVNKRHAIQMRRA